MRRKLTGLKDPDAVAFVKSIDKSSFLVEVVYTQGVVGLVGTAGSSKLVAGHHSGPGQLIKPVGTGAGFGNLVQASATYIIQVGVGAGVAGRNTAFK